MKTSKKVTLLSAIIATSLIFISCPSPSTNDNDPSSSSVTGNAQSSSSAAAPSSSSAGQTPSSSSEGQASSSSSKEQLSSSSERTSSSSMEAVLCGTVTYDPATHFCFRNVVTAKEYFTDDRDGKKYPFVTIGTQVWMAENVNYAGGVCYKDNCIVKYGRLYDWATAMNLPSDCNIWYSILGGDCKVNIPHRGICPEGWHIPTDSEWNTLIMYALEWNTLEDYVGDNQGTKLKSITGWPDNGNGTDDYGFSALPSGVRDAAGNFSPDGYGYWWTATEKGSSNAYSRYMTYNSNRVNLANGSKSNAASVRCVKD